jgi:hypothetical protein
MRRFSDRVQMHSKQTRSSRLIGPVRGVGNSPSLLSARLPRGRNVPHDSVDRVEGRRKCEAVIADDLVDGVFGGRISRSSKGSVLRLAT